MSYSSRSPPEINGMVSLKVDNLTYRSSGEDLRRTFEKFGEVGDVYIPRDRYTRESRGFAFVRYYDKRDAEDAIDAMDGTILDGRELRVQMARYGRPTENRRPQQRSRYGSNRGYSGGGRRSRSRSPNRRRHRSRSRSKSRSRSRSPRYSRSRSRSPRNARSRSHSHSASPRRSKSKSKSPSRSRSRSRS